MGYDLGHLIREIRDLKTKMAHRARRNDVWI